MIGLTSSAAIVTARQQGATTSGRPADRARVARAPLRARASQGSPPASIARGSRVATRAASDDAPKSTGAYERFMEGLSE